jgi:hypothetical protein
MEVFLIVTAFAISYGWGMRGTLLGHGQGAMLPGALLAILIALFSGEATLMENAISLGAIGGAAMYFGGDMTYGQTIGMTKDKETYYRGQIGLAWKGFLWFGVYGSLLGIGIRVLNGAIYSWQGVLVLCVFLLPLQKLGVLLFNRPHDPANNVYPKIYFSHNRPELWGGMLSILLALVVFMAVHGDVASLAMAGISAIFAAVGWYFGNYLHCRTRTPFKNGKYLFDGFTRKERIDGWKIMECVLGFFGGVGTALAYILFADGFSQKGALETAIPAWLLWALTALWLVLVIGFWIAALLADRKPPTKEELDKQLTLGHLRKDEYEKRLAKASHTERKGLLKFVHEVEDSAELVLFAIFPMLLLLQGFQPMGPLVSFFLILAVLLEAMCFRKLKLQNIIIAKVIAVLLGAAALAACFLVPDWITPFACVVLYTFGYTGVKLIHYYSPARWKEAAERKNGFGSYPSITVYFLLTSALTVWYVWYEFYRFILL